MDRACTFRTLAGRLLAEPLAAGAELAAPVRTVGIPCDRRAGKTAMRYAMHSRAIASLVMILTATSSVSGQPLDEISGPPPQEAMLLAPATEQSAMLHGGVSIAALRPAPSGESEVLAAAVRDELLQYKHGGTWPLRNFQGLDFLEPLWPRVAVARGDVGRVVLDTALPYSLLISAFAAYGSDQATLATISRWDWVGIDQAQDNDPFLAGLIGLAAASILLPGPVDQQSYSWRLRADRATVLGLGIGTSWAATSILKPLSDRTRPNGECCTSRPSGHTTTAFTAMAFLSNVLRDTLRPQDETNVGLRILKEVASAVPYLGAGYMALERVHARKHFLTDTLLGGAIGAFTMDMFYAWSFTRTEQRRSWLVEHISVGYDPSRRGAEVTIRGRF